MGGPSGEGFCVRIANRLRVWDAVCDRPGLFITRRRAITEFVSDRGSAGSCRGRTHTHQQTGPAPLRFPQSGELLELARFPHRIETLLWGFAGSTHPLPAGPSRTRPEARSARLATRSRMYAMDR